MSRSSNKPNLASRRTIWCEHCCWCPCLSNQTVLLKIAHSLCASVCCSKEPSWRGICSARPTCCMYLDKTDSSSQQLKFSTLVDTEVRAIRSAKACHRSYMYAFRNAKLFSHCSAAWTVVGTEQLTRLHLVIQQSLLMRRGTFIRSGYWGDFASSTATDITMERTQQHAVIWQAQNGGLTPPWSSQNTRPVGNTAWSHLENLPTISGRVS